jgi:hypothetical protein
MFDGHENKNGGWTSDNGSLHVDRSVVPVELVIEGVQKDI